MEADDPRTPLLGSRNGRPHAIRRLATKLCSLDSWKRRLPITIWLPKYNLEYLFRDAIAGITVGLTSIPQGIAYAIVAGLPPQVGLYSSIFPGYIYMLFGSCKDVTVGPTAILAALLSKYVAKSYDFAYLASFLSGFVILLLGVLQLGFLLDFISKPVISGFTTAAALQIGAAQLKCLFRISGSSGDTFIHAMSNFFENIKTVHLWDTLLGIISIICLILFKRAKVKPVSDTSSQAHKITAVTVQYLVRARNAIVVFVGTIVAFILYKNNLVPVALTGKIDGGLPHFGPPPFSTVVNNQTLNFEDMLSVFGPEGLVMPLVAIMESIAIAKAFAGSSVDNTQEMIAVGACNIVSSFAQSMPATGSFTRTALNHASGVMTPGGAFFKATLVLLAVTLLAEAFYFIPRATLAAIIMVAMASLIDLSIVKLLWKNSKWELAVWGVTVVTGACAGLEYGILAGAGTDVVRVLAAMAKPHLHTQVFNVGNTKCVSLSLVGTMRYPCVAALGGAVRTRTVDGAVLVLQGHHLRSLDAAVAEELISVIVELEQHNHKVLLWNFSEELQRLLEDCRPGTHSRFVSGHSIDQHVLNLSIERPEIF